MKNIAHFALMILIVLSATKVSAQGIVNPKSYGGTKSDYPYRLIKDNSGNHYIVGFFASPTLTLGTVTLTNAGDTNAFITKLDKNWNVLWAKSGQGNKVDYGLSCAVDALGNSYMVGCFYSNSITFGTTTLTNSNPTATCDLFIVKYDPSGNVLWAKKAGGNGTDKAIDVDVDNSGNVVITGWFYSSSIIFGTTTLTNSGTNATADIFVAKYNSSGTVLWAKKATGTETDEPTSLSMDAIGNIYLTGWYSSPSLVFGTTNLTNAGGFYPRRDMFIAKYNPSGTEQWAKTAGGTGQDGGCNIAVDDAGSYLYVTGSFNSDSMIFGSKTIKNSLGYDFFLARFDNSGQIMWIQSSTGIGDETGSGMAVDSRGYVYVIGGFTSVEMFIGYDTLFNKSINDPNGKLYPDVFYARYSPSGNEEWAASLGGRKYDLGTSVTIEDYNKISLTGVYTDTIQMGTGGTKLIGKGGTDIFTAEYRFINIGGSVTYNTVPVTSGYAELMRINPGKRAPIADRVYLDPSGKYRFTDVKPGSYYIYVKPDSILYPKLVKTYYANAAYWKDARIAKVLVTDTLIDTFNISMMDIISVPVGSGLISGKIVTTDGTRAAGAPIKDVEITIVKVPPSRIAKKVYTDANGDYTANGLDIGKYQVMMDIPGLKLDSAFFLNISSTATSYVNRNYAVDANGIHRDTTESAIFSNDESVGKIFIYPNPGNGKLFFKFATVNPGMYVLEIFDMSGKQVIQRSFTVKAEGEEFSLDMSSCNDGIYLMKIAASDKLYYSKLIIHR